VSGSVVRVEMDGRIGVLVLDRPRALNAISAALMVEGSDALAGLVADPRILAIVVRGEGRAFSAGFDLKEGAARGTKGG